MEKKPEENNSKSGLSSGKKVAFCSSPNHPGRICKEKSPKKVVKYQRKNTKSRTCIMGKVAIPFSSMIRSSTKTFQNPEFREYMEDIPLTQHGFMREPSKHLFAIFDGHGGDKSAKICFSLFPEIFSRFLKEYPQNIEMALKKSFSKIDSETKKQKCETVGNTATVVYISHKILYCANVGDSSCVLVSKDSAKKVSYDDKATDPAEIKRIEATGGKVFDERLEGQLAISRAIGDFDLKGKGLTSEPHLFRTIIGENDNYCVIASDGVWDVLEPMDVFNICKSEYNTDSIVDKIINDAVQKGSEDNISCIVISFK